MIISGNSFWRYFWRGQWSFAMATGVREHKKCHSDWMIILPIMWVKNTVKNVCWIFLKTADQSYLVKIVLIMQNKCSQDDITTTMWDKLAHRLTRSIPFATIKHTKYDCRNVAALNL